MNVLDAAFHVAHDFPGGAAALAQRMGKHAATLCHELKGDGTAKLGLLDAVKISHITGSQAIAQAMCGELGGVFVPMPSLAHGGELQEMAAAVKEFGETCSVYAQAVADGRVSANELRRVETEALEAIASINTLVASARALHEAGCPEKRG